MSRARFTVAGVNRINEAWSEDATEFLIQLQVEVQQIGVAGGEALSVTVASPEALASELLDDKSIEPGRGYLFMRDYDEPSVVSWLERFLEGAGAADWVELMAYVDRYFDSA